VLTAFGEPEIQALVRASMDEALKLERGLSQLRSEKRVVALHYSPIAATVQGASGGLSIHGDVTIGGSD